VHGLAVSVELVAVHLVGREMRDLYAELREQRGAPASAAADRPATRAVDSITNDPRVMRTWAPEPGQAFSAAKVKRDLAENERQQREGDDAPTGGLRVGDTYVVPPITGDVEPCVAVERGEWCERLEGHDGPHVAVERGRITKVWADYHVLDEGVAR